MARVLSCSGSQEVSGLSRIDSRFQTGPLPSDTKCSLRPRGRVMLRGWHWPCAWVDLGGPSLGSGSEPLTAIAAIFPGICSRLARESGTNAEVRFWERDLLYAAELSSNRLADCWRYRDLFPLRSSPSESGEAGAEERSREARGGTGGGSGRNRRACSRKTV